MSRLGVTDPLRDVRSALKSRPLVWFGIRGEDARPLLRLPELQASFALTAALPSASVDDDANVTLESLSGERPDLDTYDIDLDQTAAADAFRRNFLNGVSRRCVVMTYRPATFISEMAFAMSETMALAGMYKDRQAAFEHKPWVETSLMRRGVATLGWTYVPDAQHERAKRELAGGSVVLRVSRASGGVGMVLAETEEEVDRYWPVQAEQFVGVARYLEDALPLNVSGCVFPNGVVRLHPPSVQLIGIPSCTGRRFGYCGNDFGAFSQLDDDVILSFDELTRAVGRWLHDERYVGAFGVDALVHDGKVLFTEVNPRFQGSSALSASIAEEVEVPSLHVDHLAASLGVSPPGEDLTLLDWARRQEVWSHVVVHNTETSYVRRGGQERLVARVEVTQRAPAHLAIAPGATLGRLVLPRSVTSTGFDLDADTVAAVETLTQSFDVIRAGEEATARAAH